MMAVLSARKRALLKPSAFGLESLRKYPMPDASHARNALARASQQLNKGTLSPSQAARIRAKAHKMLGK